MTQYNITLSEEQVRALFLGEGDLVMKDLMEVVLNQLLISRAEEKCNAELYEQTEDRMDYRNGFRERSIITRLGKIVLEVPRLRAQSVVDGLFEKYSRSEQALIAGIAEMYVKGVSTRKIKDVAIALFGAGISKSQVSRMCAVLDPIVAEFRNRPLDKWYPFAMIDAMYLKIREEGRVISKALYIAMGINANGRKEVLGFMMSKKETKAAYVEFFKSLKARGLEKFDLVTSDNHDGLRDAIRQEFLGASWQRCQTHFSRNMLEKVPKKMWLETKEMLRNIYTAPNLKKAREKADEAVRQLSAYAPKAAELLDEAFDDITAVFSLPLKYRQKLRTSNGIERVNEEIRRRDRALRIYPSDGAVMRIIGTILVEQNEAWCTEKICFDMKEYLEHIGDRDSAVPVCSMQNVTESLCDERSLIEEVAAETSKGGQAA